MRARLDKALCVGHGRCYVLGPDVFGEDERGYCVLQGALVPPDREDQARLGEQNCPEGAIELKD